MSEITKYNKRQTVISKFFRRTLGGEKLNVGAYMWAAQRVSGLILLFYLLLHLYTLSAIFKGSVDFDHAMSLMDHPMIRLLEIALLGTVFFHALNGVRLILINFIGDIDQKILAYSFSGATIICIIISILFIF